MKSNQLRIRTVHGVEEPCSIPANRGNNSVSEEVFRRKPNREVASDKSSPTPRSSLFQTWQRERGEVATCLDDLCDWMNEVSQLGIPHFGETATRLQPLRQKLIDQFGIEDEIIERIAAARGTTLPGSEDLHQGSRREHRELVERLDDMLKRLLQPEPPFPSWQAAMNEVEQFVDMLEEHESHENERIIEVP